MYHECPRHVQNSLHGRSSPFGRLAAFLHTISIAVDAVPFKCRFLAISSEWLPNEVRGTGDRGSRMPLSLLPQLRLFYRSPSPQNYSWLRSSSFFLMRLPLMRFFFLDMLALRGTVGGRVYASYTVFF